MGQVPELNSKWKKLESKGLVVIGVTDESPALVDAWVKKNKPKYPVVILKGKEFERALGVKFFPSGAVLDPSGVITYTGSVGGMAGPLSNALADAKKGSVFPKSLSKATKLLREEKLDQSYKEVLSLLERGKLSEADLVSVELFRTYLEGQASAALDDAHEYQADGFVYMAIQRLERFCEAEPPFPTTPDCISLRDTLEALPDFKKEMKGGEAFAEAKEVDDAREYTDAVKAYKTVYKKYDGTLIAKQALARARELVDMNWTGYKAHCTSCRKQRRACPKHHEKVKL